MSMRDWKFWDWVGYASLWVSAVSLAAIEGAKNMPTVPAFVDWPITPFLPLLFLAFGSAILLGRALGWSLPLAQSRSSQPVSMEPPAGLSNEAKAVLGIEARNPASPSKRMLTSKEKEERYTAWSRIYRVLNEECSAALDKGSYVSNTWKESILSGPKVYSESIVEFQKMNGAALNKISSIYKEYEYLTDIRDYFENSWGPAQHSVSNAMNILRDTLKKFPDNPPRPMIDLLDPHAQAFRQGVGDLGKWITGAKAHAAAQIRELSSS